MVSGKEYRKKGFRSIPHTWKERWEEETEEETVTVMEEGLYHNDSLASWEELVGGKGYRG
jgi:hypothetical protein